MYSTAMCTILVDGVVVDRFKRFFSSRNGIHRKYKILSTNLNGYVSKREQPSCMNLLLDYNIVVLQEIETAFVFSLPGFICPIVQLSQENNL